MILLELGFVIRLEPCEGCHVLLIRQRERRQRESLDFDAHALVRKAILRRRGQWCDQTRSDSDSELTRSRKMLRLPLWPCYRYRVLAGYPFRNYEVFEICDTEVIGNLLIVLHEGSAHVFYCVPPDCALVQLEIRFPAVYARSTWLALPIRDIQCDFMARHANALTIGQSCRRCADAVEVAAELNTLTRT